MHPLLERQIRKKLAGVDFESGAWAEFIEAVDATYDEADREREFVERTLDVVSQELTEANERIRRDAESQLSELTRYYEQTLELQQGMIVCYREENGRFVHTLCRGALAERLGWDSARVEARALEDFLSPIEVDEWIAVYREAWAGQTVTCEGQSADGEIWYLAQLQPRLKDGLVTEVIMSAVESSEIKRTEAAMRLAKEKAENADRAKSEFLAMMSHEIRTPMNSVIGFASLLGETDLDATQQEYLEMIEESGGALLDIINDVLDISKIEAGRMVPIMGAVEPAQVAGDVIRMMQARAKEKGLTLRLQIDSSVPDRVWSDRARLRQILVNLVGNAVKFTRDGSVEVSLSYGPGEQLTGEVHDTGIGISAEGMKRLFKPFSQVDSSTTRNFGGTGLGLAICARLCDALGGGIRVSSTENEGSCFKFHISAPVCLGESGMKVADFDPADSGMTKVADSGPANGASPNGCELRMLVVDDNKTNRYLVEVILRTFGCREVEYAETGEEACAKAENDDFDVIFMDIELPGMDGLEATRCIRALPSASATYPHIVGLSAEIQQSTREEAIIAGMNAFLTKPIRREQLWEQIRKGDGTAEA